MSSTATQTYQQGIQSLQAWLDYLDREEARLQAQLAKMQGGEKSLPAIDADLPADASAETSAPPQTTDDDDAWL